MNIRDENVVSRINNAPLIGKTVNALRSVLPGNNKQTTVTSARAPLTNISNQVPQKQAPIEHKQAQKSLAPEYAPTNAMSTSPDMIQAKSVNHPIHTAPRNPPESPKVDAESADDPQHVVEFVHDIIAHYKNIETKYMPSNSYMEKQTDITATMRAILIDWLVDVHYKFKLLPDTLYLTVNILDRFLCKKLVPRARLQLAGITALLISCKYEEIMCPEVADFVDISAGGFNKEEILRMERVVLATLDFNVTVATPLPFIKRYLKCGKCDTQVTFMTHYFAELALLEYEALNYTPSMIAASCIYLANKLSGTTDPWGRNLKYYTGREEEDLQECTQFLYEIVKKSNRSKLMAVKKKYCSRSRGEIAKVVSNMLATADL